MLYQYDKRNFLDTVTYHNVVYYAETDVNGTVTKLFNEKGDCVAEYFYNNGIPTVVSEGNGGAYDLLIGEVNKVRLYSFYFDDETGYYYSYGRFYNAEQDVFVDKLSGSSIALMDCNVSWKRDTISDLGNYITNLANYYLNSNPSYGKPINEVAGWYEELSDIEILARLIYGENPFNRQDQKAVMWVLLNRYYVGYYGETLRNIATADSQFSTISGKGSYDARNPQIDTEAWKWATWLACAIHTTTVENECNALVNKPEGIANQKNFRALTGFIGKCEDSEEGIIYVYKSGARSKLIDVVIVGDWYENEWNRDKASHVKNAVKIEELEVSSANFANCIGDDYSWNFAKEAFHNVFFNEVPLK